MLDGAPSVRSRYSRSSLPRPANGDRSPRFSEASPRREAALGTYSEAESDVDGVDDEG